MLVFLIFRRGPTKYERNWEDVTAYGREKFKTSPRGAPRGQRAAGRFRGAPRFRGRGRKQFGSEDSDKKDYINEDGKDDEESIEKETGEFLLYLYFHLI